MPCAKHRISTSLSSLVVRHLHDPGRERAFARERVRTFPNDDEDVLREIVRIRRVACQLPQPVAHSALVTANQHFERTTIGVRHDASDELLVGGLGHRAALSATTS
jgi:hypothetical protein